jgi:hypothetical protein
MLMIVQHYSGVGLTRSDIKFVIVYDIAQRHRKAT